MSGYYQPTPSPEENMAGSNQAITSDANDKSKEMQSEHASAENPDSGSDEQKSEHGSDTAAHCSQCSSGDPSEETTDPNGVHHAGDGGLTGLTDILPSLKGGDIIPDIGGGQEPLGPVTDAVEAVCAGNLQSLDPGLGAGELGQAVGACLDKLTGPTGDLAGSLVDGTSTILKTIGDAVGLSNTAQGLACVIDSLGIDNIGSHTGGGVVADIVNLPHDILTGANLGDSIGQILTDAGTTLGDELPGLPVVLLKDIGQPLINADLGSDGADSPNSHLVDVDAGPQQNNGLILDLLAQPDAGPHHAAEANVIDGRKVADVDLLNSGAPIAIPSLGGTGIDSLAGLLDTPLSPQADGGAQAATSLAIVDDALAALDVEGLLDIGLTQQHSGSHTGLLHGLV